MQPDYQTVMSAYISKQYRKVLGKTYINSRSTRINANQYFIDHQAYFSGIFEMDLAESYKLGVFEIYGLVLSSKSPESTVKHTFKITHKGVKYLYYLSDDKESIYIY